MRRYPHESFSWARRRTNTRIDRTVRGRPTRLGRGDQVAMPAQHRLRSNHEPDLVQHMAGQAMQQRGQERPIGPGEPYPRPAQLPLQDGELVPQRQDLHVLGPVAHRERFETALITCCDG